MSFRLTTAILALLTLCAPAFAAYHPPVEPQSLPNGALVRVNRRTVVLLRRGSGGMPPDARAALVTERLSAAIEAGLAPGAVGARRVGREFALFAGSQELLRPTRADARAAGTTPHGLALRWARALRQALGLPPLTARPGALLVPYGQTRALRVGGVAAGPLELSSRDARVATAEVVGDGRSIRVRAGEPGSTLLAVGADGATIGVRITVRKYAGEAGAPVTVECTGRPAPGELLRQLVMERYPQALRLEPGAQVRLAGKVRLPASLAAGEEGWGNVPVRLTGPGLLPRDAVARVRLRCRRLPPREPDALLYSNDPEQIRRPGRLCVGEVDAHAPLRLLYHHQNLTGRTMLLHVDLVNPEESPAEVQVINGAARPMIDTVLVGQRAGVRYLRNAMRDVGRLDTVPGHSRLVLLEQRLPEGYTASGLYGLRLLSGRRLLVELHAEPPEGVEPPDLPLDAAALAQHLYPNPQRVLEASYTVGRHWTFVKLGKRSLPVKAASPAHHHGRVLDGDYGVLYDIAVRLDNPTPEPQVVRLYLSPDAGGAQGVFLVDGKWVEAPHVSPPAEYELAQFLLSPQEQRVVNIRTLPVGGSAYPVTLVLR